MSLKQKTWQNNVKSTTPQIQVGQQADDPQKVTAAMLSEEEDTGVEADVSEETTAQDEPETVVQPEVTQAPTQAPTVKPTSAPTPAPTQAATAAPTQAPVKNKSTTDATYVLNVIREKNNRNQLLLDQMLAEYAKKMDPRMPTNDGWGNQLRLWNRIRTAVEQCTDFEEFKLIWGTVLAYFEIHRAGAFGDPHVFRFFEKSEQEFKEFSAYQRMLNLAVTTCSTNMDARRLSLRQVDMERTFEFVWSNKAKEHFMAFYTL